MLWWVYQTVDEKIQINRVEMERSRTLELLTEFQQVSQAIYHVITAQELERYISASLQEEEKAKKKLSELVLSKTLPFENVQWVLYGPRGQKLESWGAFWDTSVVDKNVSKNLGAWLNQEGESVFITYPISYTLESGRNQVSRPSQGYMRVVIPFISIEKSLPDFRSLTKISPDLTPAGIEANFLIDIDESSLQNALYLYTGGVFLLNLIAIIFGLKTFQSQIIEKITRLTNRVRKEMPPETTPSKLNNSEIQTLSEAFYGYLRHVEFLQEEIRKTSQMAAVGMVANTIAHDVRKPFSTLSVGLTAIGQAKTLDDVRQIVTETAESLKKSKSFIEKMLSEIMEAGVTRLNLDEPIHPKTLIAGVFDILGPLPEGAQVNITYDLDRGMDFHIDTHRVMRALLNFVNNALEAMNYKGDLWFKLLPDEAAGFGKLIVGNSGSFISQDDIPHLFSPFFTKNKKKWDRLRPGDL